ncbi:SixA phosphatase family protein [Nocardioides sambongensis]|uniref:SixA phosphatase family protein n=1 Tax=Nocardioides sambongensis TaxID=2589074 RepID=UPI0011287133|nr:histidine phosphatase family protein [Nocardioides sambongensis]
MRSVVLVRHAKAESFAASDHDRRLTERGRQDAAELGRRLRALGVSPDLVYVSSARRAQQTWDGVRAAAGWDVSAHTDRGLYGADEESVLELLRVTEDVVGTVAVVGHNPTMGMLAHGLDDGHGPASSELAGGFPTATAAVLEHDGGWADLGPASSRLRLFEVGRA